MSLPFFWDLCILHWDGTFHTFQRFFTHLAAVLEKPLVDTELGTSDLVVRSDKEKALVKAVKCSFSIVVRRCTVTDPFLHTIVAEIIITSIIRCQLDPPIRVQDIGRLISLRWQCTMENRASKII